MTCSTFFGACVCVCQVDGSVLSVSRSVNMQQAAMITPLRRTIFNILSGSELSTAV